MSVVGCIVLWRWRKWVSWHIHVPITIIALHAHVHTLSAMSTDTFSTTPQGFCELTSLLLQYLLVKENHKYLKSVKHTSLCTNKLQLSCLVITWLTGQVVEYTTHVKSIFCAPCCLSINTFYNWPQIFWFSHFLTHKWSECWSSNAFEARIICLEQ